MFAIIVLCRLSCSKGRICAYTHLFNFQDPPQAIHVCDICGKGFKRKSNLQEHIPTHSDTRTFLCTICGRYLKTDNSYRRHMVCVHGVKYTCCVCRKDFSSQLGMQIHQRDKHGMTTWKEISMLNCCKLSQNYEKEDWS